MLAPSQKYKFLINTSLKLMKINGVLFVYLCCIYFVNFMATSKFIFLELFEQSFQVRVSPTKMTLVGTPCIASSIKH